MWNTKVFDQWRSYLSLKTSVLVAFLIIWNLGFVVAMYGFGDGFGAPITPNAGIVISVICICACIFGLIVSFSEKFRNNLLEPKRAHDYRVKDFYLLSFITFVLAVGMLLFPGMQGA